jgi:hypothetical protein
MPLSGMSFFPGQAHIRTLGRKNGATSKWQQRRAIAGRPIPVIGIILSGVMVKPLRRY